MNDHDVEQMLGDDPEVGAALDELLGMLTLRTRYLDGATLDEAIDELGPGSDQWRRAIELVAYLDVRDADWRSAS